ncbi:hypothetical protein C8R45DRAFT_1077765 [Mycena sanguinolenta]|nr:hypothetical protein C8R45DRAFT_1077765 [Mycena sanguinolenta]
MPPSSVSEIVVDNIVTSVNAVIPLLDELHDGLCPPFVQAISNTVVSLISMLQNVKRNKEECCQLMENIHGIIYAIVNAHLQSDPPGCLPPAMLEHVVTDTILPRTLHKIHTFVQAQQGNSKFKHFFQQNQISALLKDCRAGLQLALDNFTIISRATLSHDIDEMRRKTHHMHAELLEMISTLSDSTTSDRASSIRTSTKSQASSQSLPLLPSMPQIFHGRESELAQIVQLLDQQCAKIAILGPGGIGKTSLARAALHHPDVAAKYEDRLFVSCESATTSIEIAGFIGAHLGLKPEKNMIKKSTCLLILDNLETTWEPLESRGGTEDLLSNLTDISHLALIITMRGAEHPSKVRWSRPFLPALAPLSAEAAQEMFKEIAEDYHEPKDIDRLLKFTDNMPLAVDLMAHLVAYEGCSPVLARLEIEKTSMLSEGSDKQSNLDTSIALSLSSPRLTAQTGAMDLLRLLSILPDGLSDVELIQSNLVIPQIQTCRSILLSTSLAYFDNKKRLKSLVPIREYLQHFHPVALAIIQPLQRHFQSLLGTYKKYAGSTQVTNIVRDITLNLRNIHQVLSQALTPQNPGLPEAIRCALFLNDFARFTGHGTHALMYSIQAILPPGDHTLAVEFISTVLTDTGYCLSIKDHELLASEAKVHCQISNDPALQMKLYRALGVYYCSTTDFDKGMQCFERAVTLARDADNIQAQYRTLNQLALHNWTIGKYNISQMLADEVYSLAQLCGDCYSQANALRVKALSAKSLGNFKDSLSLLQTTKELLHLCGMSQGVMGFSIGNNIADTLMEKSEYAEARGLLTQVASEMPAEQKGSFAVVLLNIAHIGVVTGASRQDVLQNLEVTKTIFSSLEYLPGIFSSEMVLADLELREGDMLAAKNRFEKCLHWSWARDSELLSYCLEKMADMSRWEAADFDWVATFAISHLAFAQKTKQKLGLYKALYSLGSMFLFNGDELTAESLFTVALEAFTEMDVHHWRAKSVHQGHISGAERQWRDAHPLFERSLQAKDMANIDSRLAIVENLHVNICVSSELLDLGRKIEAYMVVFINVASRANFGGEACAPSG